MERNKKLKKQYLIAAVICLGLFILLLSSDNIGIKYFCGVGMVTSVVASMTPFEEWGEGD